MSATRRGRRGADWPYIAANVRDATTAATPSGADSHRRQLRPRQRRHLVEGLLRPRRRQRHPRRLRRRGHRGPRLAGGAVLDRRAGDHRASSTRSTPRPTPCKADGCGGEPCDLVVELVHEGAPSPSCATIGTDDGLDLRPHRPRDQRRRRRDHLGPHPPEVQLQGGRGGQGARTVRSSRPASTAPTSTSSSSTSRPGTDDLVGIRQHVLAMKDYDEDAATAGDRRRRGRRRGRQGCRSSSARSRVRSSGPVASTRSAARSRTAAASRPWATWSRRCSAAKTGADIGVMNPGGLRDDLIGTGDGPGPVTYREAANVQPFANTLVTVDLTGAPAQDAPRAAVAARPRQQHPVAAVPAAGHLEGLHLDRGLLAGPRATGSPACGSTARRDRPRRATYTVSANSFIATGGDNFRALDAGHRQRRTPG